MSETGSTSARPDPIDPEAGGEGAARRDRDIDDFLARHERKELLRFVTIGSVDDGKSTLIGRLLHDTDGLYDDQLDAIRSTTAGGGGGLDLALVTDGLEDERQQGITIDVAYRYFSTPRRKFIIADTPGHVQYTRNMATGASTADLAVILVDAREGVQEQTLRHAYIASLLGIPNLVVTVNKMDLVGFSREVFDAIRGALEGAVSGMGFSRVTCLPISALEGDNVVHRSERASWYGGPSLLALLESVPVGRRTDAAHFAFPVQYVLRPDQDFRGFCGTIAAGRVRAGDEVVALPSGRRTRVAELVGFGGALDEAFAPMSVTLRLEDEIDVSRGDMLVHPKSGLRVARQLEVMLVWMNEAPAQLNRQYYFKHTTRVVTGELEAIHGKVDLATREEVAAQGQLALNEIGRVSLHLNRPLIVERYAEDRVAGALIVIDRLSNATVGAGVITGFVEAEGEARGVRPEERARRHAQRPCVVWLVAGSGEGAEALAERLERRLFDSGHMPLILGREEGGAADASTMALGQRLGLLMLCPVGVDGAEGVSVYIDTDPRAWQGRLGTLREAPERARTQAPDLTVEDRREALSPILLLLQSRGLLR